VGNLTARQCETLLDGKYSDGDGLRLIVRGDTRAWCMLYVAPDGRRRELGLGPLRDVGLADARKHAATARDKVRNGVDPLQEKVRLREEAENKKAQLKAATAAGEATLRRIVRDYHEKSVEPVRSRKYGMQWLASIENHVPATMLDKPISICAVEPGAWIDVLQPIERELPMTGRRIRQRLDCVFDSAVLRGIAPANPMKGIVRELRKARPKGKAGHFRALPFADAPALFKQLDALPGTSARCLQFLMLTCARTSEALDMPWTELSADGKTWTVPAPRMKGKEDEHVCYLTTPARAILARVKGLSTEWVFPSPTKDAPLSNMAMLTLLRRLGIEKQTTIHGMRSVFSTWAYQLNMARPDVIEATLSHKEADRVRAAYDRRTPISFAVERRQLLEQWGNFLSPPAKKKSKVQSRRKAK
jgi:integrase